MDKNKDSIKHHYIPQFFLNSFAKKEKGKEYIINVFDKRYLNKFTNSVGNIGYIKKFHTIKINGKESDLFEKAHNEIYEKRYSKEYSYIIGRLEKYRQDLNVINCISNKRNFEMITKEQFSDSEKIFFSFLLAYFIVRGKKWREFGEKSFKKAEELMRYVATAYKFENIEEKIKSELGDIEGVKHAQLQATFKGNEISEFANYFYKHIWNIGFNMTENCFYASDNVHALTTMWKEQPECWGIGYMTYGNLIIFPISPKICIIMYDPIYINEQNIKIIDKNYVILDKKQISLINNEIILSSIDQVYSIDGNWIDLDNCYKVNKLEKGHKPYSIK